MIFCFGLSQMQLEIARPHSSLRTGDLRPKFLGQHPIDQSLSVQLSTDDRQYVELEMKLQMRNGPMSNAEDRHRNRNPLGQCTCNGCK